MIDIVKFNSAIGWVKNYTKIFRGYLVKLRVTNSYAQKKKDSVQAVLIQLHSVELVTNNNSLRVLVTNLPSLRGEVSRLLSLRGLATNYPDNIELVSRLPNNIGLPDYIGLVKYCQSSIGGWDLNLVNNVHSIQPLGSMSCRSNSLRARSFSQLPRLTLSRSAAASSCSLNSGASLILNIGDFPAPFGLLSLFIVDMYRPVEIVLMTLGLYTNIFNIDRTTPRSAANTVEAFNHNVNRGNTMAMYKSTQTHPKFLWRFFSCQQSKYFSVEANNEQEARSLLPDSPCLFSARIRQGVNRA